MVTTDDLEAEMVTAAQIMTADNLPVTRGQPWQAETPLAARDCLEGIEQEERLAEPGSPVNPPPSPQSMLSPFPPVVVDELMRIINKPRNMRAAITDCVNDLVWLGHFD